MSDKVILRTPIRDEDLLDLRVGDVVYLTGHIVTCRDVAHRRLVEQKRELPVDLKGGAIFQASARYLSKFVIYQGQSFDTSTGQEHVLTYLGPGEKQVPTNNN